MKRRGFSYVLVLLLIPTTMLICFNNPLSATAAEVPGVGKDYVKVGSFMAITGILARMVAEGEAGFRSYLNFINEKGGVHGRKIEVLTEDDGFSETKALMAAKKLVERDKVFMLFHTIGSGPTMATLPYIAATGIPFIAPGCGSRVVCEPLKRNIFGSLWGVYGYMAEALLPYLVNNLGYKKIAYMHQNEDVAKEMLELVRAKMNEMGLKLVAEVPFERGVAQYGIHLAKVRAAAPEVVVFQSSTADIARAIVQAREMDFRAVFSGVTPMSDRILLDLAGKDAEGAIAASPLLPLDSDRPAMVQFRELLKKYYPNTKPGMWGCLGFGAGKVLVEVLQRTGPNLSWENVIKAAETMRNWEIGIGPPITYTPEDHSGTRGVMILKVINGKFVPQTDWFYPRK